MWSARSTAYHCRRAQRPTTNLGADRAAVRSRLPGCWPQCPHVRQTLQDLALCRTHALGGHVTQCDHCGEVRYHYHSCGNRSCPECGGSKRSAWLAKCQADLLPVPYYAHAEAMASSSSRTLEKRGFPPDELHIASSSCDYRDVSQSRSPLSFCQEGIAGVGDLVLALSKARRFMSRLARA